MNTQQQLTHQPALPVSVNGTAQKAIFIVLAIFCLTPYASPAMALVLGLVIAQTTGHPYLHLNNKATHFLLQASVVGLGFGINVNAALQAGKQGVMFTIVSIAGTLLTGYFLGKQLKTGKKNFFPHLCRNSHLRRERYCSYCAGN